MAMQVHNLKFPLLDLPRSVARALTDLPVALLVALLGACWGPQAVDTFSRKAPFRPGATFSDEPTDQASGSSEKEIFVKILSPSGYRWRFFHLKLPVLLKFPFRQAPGRGAPAGSSRILPRGAPGWRRCPRYRGCSNGGYLFLIVVLLILS